MKPLGKWVRKDPSYLKLGASSGCRSTGSKKRGLDYHRSVYRRLRAVYPFRDLQDGSDGSNLQADLLIEPWYKRLGERPVFRQPDAVILFPEFRTGIVVEVKLNWADGRDIKLIDEYLHIVKSAEGLEVVWPLLITQCLRGWKGKPLFGLEEIERCQSWLQGEPTPVMLLV